MNESTYSTVPRPAPEPDRPLTWHDAAAPALALFLSILYWNIFDLETMFDALPGLGIPVFAAAFFAAALVITGKRFTAESGFLMGAGLLLAVSCALYAHAGLTILNCFAILLLSAMATFSLSGQSRYGVLNLRAIPETVRLSFLALFTRIDRPFRAAKQCSRRDTGTLLRIAATVLGTAVLLAIVLALLASADMVFGSFFDGIAERLREFSFGTILWHIVRAVVLALLFASGLCFLRDPAPPVREKSRSAAERRALPFLIPVLALDAVYAVFCVIQLRYLFGGAEAAAMAGGWAEYARAGFFQLVAVAVIDLALCLFGTDEARFAGKGGAALRVADAVLLLLTAVILVSAWYRMHLYIAAFGLSVLRLMTLWGMLVIALGLLIAGWKLFRPSFGFWRVFSAAAVVSWTLLNLAGPAKQVANYNVDAYLDGRLPQADVDYLWELGCDARPAVERLLAESDEYDADARNALTAFDAEAHDAAKHWSTRTWSANHGR